MWLHKSSYANFNFLAPAGMTDESVNEVLFPMHKSQSVDGSENVVIDQMVNFVDLGEMGAATTLNLDISAQLTPGAILNVKASSDSTARALTLGTGITAAAISGTASKTKVQSFIYNGSTFLPLGAPVQID